MGQELQACSWQKDWKIYIEIALLTVLCVSQYMGISVGNLMLTGCVVAIHLWMDDIEECTIGLFCALPLFNLLNIRIGSISMYYLMVFIFWLRYFQYCSWRINKTKLLILLALFMLRLTSGEIKGTITWFVLISVVVMTYGEEFFDRNIQKIVLFITVTFLISSLAGYLMLKAGKSIYTGGTVWAGTTMSIRFAGVIGDPVFFSQCCSFLAAANLTLACTNRSYFVLGIFFTGCTLLMCLETYAKTGMLLIALCAVASTVWLIWDRLQNKRTAMFSIILTFGSVIAAGFLVNYILTNTDNLIIQNYIARLSSDDLLTGRKDIWGHYISMLGDSWRSLFFALSIEDYSTPFFVASDRSFNNPHNVFLESACLFGIIPTLIMLLFIFVLMYRCLIRRKGILWQMPICVILASGVTLHGHLEFHYYTLIAIALSYLSCNQIDSRIRQMR